MSKGNVVGEVLSFGEVRSIICSIINFWRCLTGFDEAGEVAMQVGSGLVYKSRNLHRYKCTKNSV